MHIVSVQQHPDSGRRTSPVFVEHVRLGRPVLPRGAGPDESRRRALAQADLLVADGLNRLTRYGRGPAER